MVMLMADRLSDRIAVTLPEEIRVDGPAPCHSAVSDFVMDSKDTSIAVAHRSTTPPVAAARL